MMKLNAYFVVVSGFSSYLGNLASLFRRKAVNGPYPGSRRVLKHVCSYCICE